MNFKKTVAIATAAGALAALSVPAMAMENEFHGMYRAYGYMTNALSGGGTFHLVENSRTDKYFEQRARLQYTAKASNDLKLVTQFEIDTKFGGGEATKYQTGDAGTLDADTVTLETKNVYLDFNCPITGANVKLGIQPFNDALAGNFGNFDATGITLSKKFGALTATYGYFTVGHDAGVTTFDTNSSTQDLNVLDAKFALSKDLTLGGSYYLQFDKVGTETFGKSTVGLNAAAKFGPASLNAAAGLQFGKSGNASLATTGTTAFAANVNAKIAAGPGAVNVAAIYLSGDDNGTGYNRAWQSIAPGVNYYTPANMWLITRNAATINSSTAIGGSSDLTRGGAGLFGFFGGYAGTAGKVFYDANVGYAQVAQERAADSKAIGTELNATVGYKLYDNLKISATGAYAFLGDYYDTADQDNPFLTNIAFNYTF